MAKDITRSASVPRAMARAARIEPPWPTATISRPRWASVSTCHGLADARHDVEKALAVRRPFACRPQREGVLFGAAKRMEFLIGKPVPATDMLFGDVGVDEADGRPCVATRSQDGCGSVARALQMARHPYRVRLAIERPRQRRWRCPKGRPDSPPARKCGRHGRSRAHAAPTTSESRLLARACQSRATRASSMTTALPCCTAPSTSPVTPPIWRRASHVIADATTAPAAIATTPSK